MVEPRPRVQYTSQCCCPGSVHRASSTVCGIQLYESRRAGSSYASTVCVYVEPVRCTRARPGACSTEPAKIQLRVGVAELFEEVRAVHERLCTCVLEESMVSKLPTEHFD